MREQTQFTLILIGMVVARLSLEFGVVGVCVSPLAGYAGDPMQQIQVRMSDPHSGVLSLDIAGISQGSCFVVAKRADLYYAITAAHCVQDFDYVSGELVTITDLIVDGSQATVLAVDATNDIALIRFQSKRDLTVYSFAAARLGEPCTAVGFSRNSKLAYKGYVVSLDYGGSIVANGGVVPGCSGGVLLNAHNQAIGVTVAVAIYGPWAFDSTGLYVPIRYAQALLVRASL